MLHPTQTTANDNDLADLFAPLDEPEGYADWALKEEIAKAVHRIRREQRIPPFGIRTTNRSESESLRDFFAELLRPYGLRVSRAPNWRGREYT